MNCFIRFIIYNASTSISFGPKGLLFLSVIAGWFYQRFLIQFPEIVLYLSHLLFQLHFHFQNISHYFKFWSNPYNFYWSIHLEKDCFQWQETGCSLALICYCYHFFYCDFLEHWQMSHHQIRIFNHCNPYHSNCPLWPHFQLIS